jgi:hypothetical protein
MAVIAVVAVGIAEHMDVSETGMQHVVQGQRNPNPLITAVGKLLAHITIAVTE